MDTSWAAAKAESIFRKHGISFEEAATVIQSAMTVTSDYSLRQALGGYGGGL